MSNVESLIADIRSDLNKYSDAGLIDETSIYKDINLGLRRFGNDVSHPQEKVIEIEGGYGKLPKNFFSLDFAYLCEPLGYNSDIEIHDLQSSYFYTEKTRFTSEWNECGGDCCEEQSETIIRENLYFNRSKAEFYYKNPVLLKLGRGFQKSNCQITCRNKIVRDCPYEINIVNFTLESNFNKGYVYIQYYGLPLDEDGEIEIPSTPNGHLETYLEYYLKRRLAERLLGNSDSPGLQAMYPIYFQNEKSHLIQAINELKMKSITPRTTKRIQRLNRLESLQYENNIQWQARRV